MPATPNEIPAITGRRRGASLFGFYLLSIGVALVGNLAIRLGERGGWLIPPAQATLAVLASLPLAIAALFFWRMLRRDLDEMLERIVLEGMAIALSIFVPLAALYMNLHAAGVLTTIDAPDIVLTPAVLVALGIAIASRRYE